MRRRSDRVRGGPRPGLACGKGLPYSSPSLLEIPGTERRRRIRWTSTPGVMSKTPRLYRSRSGFGSVTTQRSRTWTADPDRPVRILVRRLVEGMEWAEFLQVTYALREHRGGWSPRDRAEDYSLIPSVEFSSKGRPPPPHRRLPLQPVRAPLRRGPPTGRLYPVSQARGQPSTASSKTNSPRCFRPSGKRANSANHSRPYGAGDFSLWNPRTHDYPLGGRGPSFRCPWGPIKHPLSRSPLDPVSA